MANHPVAGSIIVEHMKSKIELPFKAFLGQCAHFSGYFNSIPGMVPNTAPNLNLADVSHSMASRDNVGLS